MLHRDNFILLLNDTVTFCFYCEVTFCKEANTFHQHFTSIMQSNTTTLLHSHTQKHTECINVQGSMLQNMGKDPLHAILSGMSNSPQQDCFAYVHLHIVPCVCLNDTVTLCFYCEVTFCKEANTFHQHFTSIMQSNTTTLLHSHTQKHTECINVQGSMLQNMGKDPLHAILSGMSNSPQQDCSAYVHLHIVPCVCLRLSMTQ